MTEKKRLYARMYQRKLLLLDPKNYYKRIAKSIKKWRKRNPEKATAHRIVFVEIRAGRLKRGNCFCGLIGEAHHKDYSKPLEIQWLCKEHHYDQHRKKLYIVDRF